MWIRWCQRPSLVQMAYGREQPVFLSNVHGALVLDARHAATGIGDCQGVSTPRAPAAPGSG
jgi:hypothetical protein